MNLYRLCCITVATANDPQILYAGGLRTDITDYQTVCLSSLFLFPAFIFHCFFSVSSTPWTRLLYLHYTVSQKNVHLWLAITFEACERILVFFGRSVIDEVSNQKTLYYITSNHYLVKWGNAKIALSPQMLY